MKKIKVETFRPLKFRVTPYSILAEDLGDCLRTVCENELPLSPHMGREQRDKLIDALYQEVTLVLTEDIDFEG